MPLTSMEHLGFRALAVLCVVWMQIENPVSCFLGLGGRSKHGPLIFAQDAEPMADVTCMVGAGARA